MLHDHQHIGILRNLRVRTVKESWHHDCVECPTFTRHIDCTYSAEYTDGQWTRGYVSPYINCSGEDALTNFAESAVPALRMKNLRNVMAIVEGTQFLLLEAKTCGKTSG